MDFSDAPVAEMPHEVKPMLACLVESAFDDPNWLFEIKWDGYRAIAEVDQGAVRLYSRSGQSFTERFAPVADALAKLDMQAVLDGEIVVVDDTSAARFNLLQNYRTSGAARWCTMSSTCFTWRGTHSISLPLVRRKEILQAALPQLDHVRFSSHIEANGTGLFREVALRGLEGVMAKRARAPTGWGERSRDWLKIRSTMRQEAVIGGFTEGRGGRKWFGSLILGIFTARGLEYVGHAGSGISDSELSEIAATLQPLVIDRCPFV